MSTLGGHVRLQPLLKWPGGKRQLVKHILPLIPAQFGTYYEPFVGGAALFFAIRPQRAVLGDINADLINCYEQIRSDPEGLIRELRRFPNSEEFYKILRNRRCRTALTRAARFIYLTKLSFNGLYRVNLKGAFNVPYGQKLHITPCEPDKIRTASSALGSTRIRCADFTVTVKNARVGDLVYLDPPYTVAHSNNGFLKYNARIFKWSDQIRLANLARTLADRGCKVIVSNAGSESIRALYKDFSVSVIQRPSLIAASEEFRKDIVEFIFHSH